MPSVKDIALIGYSGHAYVIADIFLSSKRPVKAYCDKEKKTYDPFGLHYLGPESSAEVIAQLKQYDYFIAVGDNTIREKIYNVIAAQLGKSVNAVHASAILSPSVIMQDGVMIAAGVTINPLSKIGKGAICNTSSSIDHECVVGDFAHIGPGAILCGNVKVGKGSFIGAGAVIRQSITIGDNVMIGAGCVVVKDVPDGSKMVGNPQRKLG